MTDATAEYTPQGVRIGARIGANYLVFAFAHNHGESFALGVRETRDNGCEYAAWHLDERHVPYAGKYFHSQDHGGQSNAFDALARSLRGSLGDGFWYQWHGAP